MPGAASRSCHCATMSLRLSLVPEHFSDRRSCCGATFHRPRRPRRYLVAAILRQARSTWARVGAVGSGLGLGLRTRLSRSRPGPLPPLAWR